MPFRTTVRAYAVQASEKGRCLRFFERWLRHALAVIIPQIECGMGTSSASLSQKELDDIRKNAGRVGQKEIATSYGTPLASSSANSSKRAVSKSKLKTIRSNSGRANQKALATWKKDQGKKLLRKRVTTKH